MMFNPNAQSAAAASNSNTNSLGLTTQLSENSQSLAEYKEAASKVVNRVGEKASELKSQAADWFSTFTSPQ